ncbi:hypothetical protein K8I28_02385 [bacterium]|nr:hypothetical protein [bacterium]
MSEKKQNIDKVQRMRDPDLAAAEIAMKRAAKKAQQKASRLGTGVVVWKDGRVVEERQSTPTGE